MPHSNAWLLARSVFHVIFGCSGQVLDMDPSDKAACAMCLESAVASLSAALRPAQADFDSLQAECFQGGHLWSTPGWAEETFDAWSSTCGIKQIAAVAQTLHDKVGCGTVSKCILCHSLNTV